MSQKNFSAICHQYAIDVDSGKISACVYVKQSVKRYLNDLEKTDWQWRFDANKVDHVCRFIELLPHTQGKWATARQRIVLEPFQIFIVANIFGWVDADGRRRYRYAYVEMPRKNGKSTLLAAVGLYCAFIEGEQGAQVYSAATTRDQARIVWEEAQRMVNRLPKLQSAFDVKAGQHSIFSNSTASSFKALSRDQGGNQDGLNVHCALVDELHAHKSSEMLDVLESATGAREQPVVIMITTAGFDLHGVCYRERQTVIDILADKVGHDRYFGIIYTIDDGDDWTSPDTWRKANPNYGVSVQEEALAAACEKAKLQPTAQTNFLTKHLCVWVNARSSWMDMQLWAACADKHLSPEQFTGCPLFIGLDLASKSDLAGKVRVFMRPQGEEQHFYVFSDQYINEETAELPTNRQYLAWARQGYLTLTDGNVTDFAQIEQDILEDFSNFELKEVGFDPFNAVYIAQRLQAAGVSVVEIPQQTRFLSEPMKWIEVLVRSGRLHHNGDPVLSWAISNVTVKPDANDNIFPRKDAPENKIDPAVALINAMARAIHFDEVGSLDNSSDAAMDDYLRDFVRVSKK
ncbi:MAG: terminase large subunit [Acinetobacter sp.]|uniref:terminase large subunit n=1 Tax=Acinetobacter sp. TaxID=472 RepID=UPI000FBFD778|nr:terminase TerL endonuclease subunit [Acinetobacter sp.]RUP37855.1 MAG: terminase large subunit [Acinetobacter sp.]